MSKKVEKTHGSDGQALTRSRFVSAHLSAIVCIFRPRRSPLKHNYAYVSHMPRVTSSWAQRGKKREEKKSYFVRQVEMRTE